MQASNNVASATPQKGRLSIGVVPAEERVGERIAREKARIEEGFLGLSEGGVAHGGRSGVGVCSAIGAQLNLTFMR